MNFCINEFCLQKDNYEIELILDAFAREREERFHKKISGENTNVRKGDDRLKKHIFNYKDGEQFPSVVDYYGNIIEY